MSYKVGDMILHKRLGLMVLTEDLNRKEELLSKYHGVSLFTMKCLISGSEASYTLKEKSLDKTRLATDNDICEKLSEMICDISLTDNLAITFYPNSEAISIRSIGDTDNGWIWLEKDAIKALKKQLKEINV